MDAFLALTSINVALVAKMVEEHLGRKEYELAAETVSLNIPRGYLSDESTMARVEMISNVVFKALAGGDLKAAKRIAERFPDDVGVVAKGAIEICDEWEDEPDRSKQATLTAPAEFFAGC